MLFGLEKLIARLTAFKPELPKVVEKELRLEEKEIVKMVRSQLAKGFDGNDEPVYLINKRGQKHYNYHKYTLWRKDVFGHGIGSITDHITNFMSGQFYNSLYVEFKDGDDFEVKSNSPLIWLIKERSGDAIINLSWESEQFLWQNEVAPDLQEVINELFWT